MHLRTTVLVAAILWSVAGSKSPAVEDYGVAPTANKQPATDEAEQAIKGFAVPKGFKCELVAAEPLLANPVAFSIDERGRFFVAETFRFGAGVPDIRGRMHWLDTELASRSVAERIAYTKRIEPDNTAWWTNRDDQVVLLWDENGDGKLDQVKTFAKGFNNLEEGLGAGVLAYRGTVYYTDIPNLWVLRDTNHDGVADVRQSLSYGYGVRYGFLGHDLHGLQIGPDGRLYFSIGDRGAHVTLPDGKVVKNLEAGAVYRCDLDGRNLEIVHVGLRNPQELTFDDYGNLWTVDNNSDASDPARVVYVVEGGDSGWRMGWQFINAPIARSSWIGERICFEDFPGRAAYALPPVSDKVSNGPSGLTLDPGVGLPARWQGHFFLCNFSGSPTPNSGILAFTVKPSGAGFALGEVEKFWWNFLPTDVDFGYDGCLYASDWINGWEGTGKGRIYRVFEPEARQQPVIAQVKKLFAEGFEQRGNPELVELLAHPDRRVRREAQFALVAHKAESELTRVAAQNSSLLARLHAIWGLGQLARAGQKIDFTNLSNDSQPEVRAQAAKVVGDVQTVQYEKQLVSLLTDAEPRVGYFAAQSLAKIGRAEDLPAVLTMLRERGNDPWLRHAGVMALRHCATETELGALHRDAAVNVRLAAVVALRLQASPKLVEFLADADPLVVAEAARAINDLPVVEALPALAALVEKRPQFARMSAGPTEAPTPRDAILRRVINANFRLGAPQSAERLALLAAAKEFPESLRLEALTLLGEWAKPDGKDHITGLWRPLPARPALEAGKISRVLLLALTNAPSEKLTTALFALAGKEKWSSFESSAFAQVAEAQAKPALRIAALQMLGDSAAPKYEAALQLALDSQAESLRLAALKLRAKASGTEHSVSELRQRLANGTVSEKQAVYAILGDMDGPDVNRLLTRQLNDLKAGKIDAAVQLDLLEAAAKHPDSRVQAGLTAFNKSRADQPGVAQFSECLLGGNAENGRKIFHDKIEASCIRCHKVTGEGGDAGPNLSQIGSRADRAYILESITFPNNKIAPGFENVQGVLNNGASYAGLLKNETDESIEIFSPEDGLMKIKKSDIKTRQRGLSGMLDNMREVLTKREIRDLVEYLAQLK